MYVAKGSPFPLFPVKNSGCVGFYIYKLVSESELLWKYLSKINKIFELDFCYFKHHAEK
jgi:hypothetical protein